MNKSDVMQTQLHQLHQEVATALEAEMKACPFFDPGYEIRLSRPIQVCLPPVPCFQVTGFEWEQLESGPVIVATVNRIFVTDPGTLDLTHLSLENKLDALEQMETNFWYLAKQKTQEEQEA